LAKGLLYVEFGSSDQGTILPIIFPLLALLTNTVFNDMMVSTEVVSSAAALFTSIPLYLIFRRFSSNYFSVVGVLLIQLNYQLCLWAVTPLTEATFIFVLSWFIYLLFRIVDSKKKTKAIILLGMFTAIAFLTRQIGLVLLPFALMALVLISPKHILKNFSGFALGFLLLLLPYGLTLYEQTGLSVFDQKWSEKESIAIEHLPIETQSFIRSVNASSAEDYQDLIVNRRALRVLLADSSAMLEDVSLESTNKESKGLRPTFSLIWMERGQYFVRLGQNISFLVQSLGLIISVVFCFSLVSPLIIKTPNKNILNRYIVSGFVLNYLFALSLIDGLIDRYALILLPFILFNIALETYNFLYSFKDRIGNPHALKGMFAAVLAAFVLLQPSSVLDIQLQEKSSETAGPFAPFRPYVTRGEPVMALSPLYSHLVNGSWRIMPNDSIEKIALYAEQEGIPWLLIVRGMSDADVEISYYQNAIDWYFDQELIVNHSKYLELHAHSNDGRIVLFRFKTSKNSPSLSPYKKDPITQPKIA